MIPEVRYNQQLTTWIVNELKIFVSDIFLCTVNITHSVKLWYIQVSRDKQLEYPFYKSLKTEFNLHYT
jgi:hypothetical protein